MDIHGQKAKCFQGGATEDTGYMKVRNYSFLPDRLPRTGLLQAFLAIVLLCAMLADISHNYLWGPDEPREAEIAREVLTGNNWITPHLDGLPFLEKPPLYYDLVAAAFALTGKIKPTVARSVSTLLGVLMLASVFMFGYLWGGTRRAWLAAIALITMPQFYRYSHWILLDIGVGALCTMALVTFACWLWWPPRETRWDLLPYAFYLLCAAAFLTKGLVAIFHVVLIIGIFYIVGRRRQAISGLFSLFPMLFFMIPVGIWIYLYTCTSRREGFVF